LLWTFKKGRNKQWHNSVSFSKAKASYCFYCDLQTTDLFPEFRVNKEPDLNRLHGFFIIYLCCNMNRLYDVT